MKRFKCDSCHKKLLPKNEFGFCKPCKRKEIDKEQWFDWGGSILDKRDRQYGEIERGIRKVLKTIEGRVSYRDLREIAKLAAGDAAGNLLIRYVNSK
jgi:hypothetical protein